MAHKLVKLFGLSANEIFDVVLRNNRCYVNLKGAIAQEHLARYLDRLKRRKFIESYERIDVDGQPDFRVWYKGKQFLMECKNVQKESPGRDKRISIDFWKTRYQKSAGPISRFYLETEFDILAACLFNRTGKWEFLFIPTDALPRHPEDRRRFHNRVSLDPGTLYGKRWLKDLEKVLKVVKLRKRLKD